MSEEAMLCRRCTTANGRSSDQQLKPLHHSHPQDAWRGRQSAATTLAHMDSFFKTVLTSSMGNDLQVWAGGWWCGWVAGGGEGCTAVGN